MSIDLSKLSPAPWWADNRGRSIDEFHHVVIDRDGKILFDTLNSDAAKKGVSRWDEQGRIDLEFVALARNAFAGDPEAKAWWEANRVKWVKS